MVIKVGDKVKLTDSAYVYGSARGSFEFKNKLPLIVKYIRDISGMDGVGCTVCGFTHKKGKYYEFTCSDILFTECEVIPLLDKKINKILDL
mgnify:CR=1 FL=1